MKQTNALFTEAFAEEKLWEEMQAELLFVSAALAGGFALKSIWIDLRAIIAEQSPTMGLFISVFHLLLLSCFPSFLHVCTQRPGSVITALWNHFLKLEFHADRFKRGPFNQAKRLFTFSSRKTSKTSQLQVLCSFLFSPLENKGCFEYSIK